MKRQGIFPGTILIGTGLFFLLKQFNLQLVHYLNSWPSLFLIIGLAFLLQAYVGKEQHSLFPGIVLLGFGIHFLGLNHFGFWPSGWPIYFLIPGIAFLLQYRKTKKDGLILGIVLIFIGLLGLVSSSYIQPVGRIISMIQSFWPITLIVIGLILLFKKK